MSRIKHHHHATTPPPPPTSTPSATPDGTLRAPPTCTLRAAPTFAKAPAAPDTSSFQPKGTRSGPALHVPTPGKAEPKAATVQAAPLYTTADAKTK